MSGTTDQNEWSRRFPADPKDPKKWQSRGSMVHQPTVEILAG